MIEGGGRLHTMEQDERGMKQPVGDGVEGKRGLQGKERFEEQDKTKGGRRQKEGTRRKEGTRPRKGDRRGMKGNRKAGKGKTMSC